MGRLDGRRGILIAVSASVFGEVHISNPSSPYVLSAERTISVFNLVTSECARAPKVSPLALRVPRGA